MSLRRVPGCKVQAGVPSRASGPAKRNSVPAGLVGRKARTPCRAFCLLAETSTGPGRLSQGGEHGRTGPRPQGNRRLGRPAAGPRGRVGVQQLEAAGKHPAGHNRTARGSRVPGPATARALCGLLRVLRALASSCSVGHAGQVGPAVEAGSPAHGVHCHRVPAAWLPALERHLSPGSGRRADAAVVAARSVLVANQAGGLVGGTTGLDGPVSPVSTWQTAA